MKGRNADCRSFVHKRRDWIRKRLKFTVKIIFFGAAIGSKNYARQEYLSSGLGTADQPLMGFTVSLFYNEQFRTPTMCDIAEQHFRLQFSLHLLPQNHPK